MSSSEPIDLTTSQGSDCDADDSDGDSISVNKNTREKKVKYPKSTAKKQPVAPGARSASCNQVNEDDLKAYYLQSPSRKEELLNQISTQIKICEKLISNDFCSKDKESIEEMEKLGPIIKGLFQDYQSNIANVCSLNLKGFKELEAKVKNESEQNVFHFQHMFDRKNAEFHKSLDMKSDETQKKLDQEQKHLKSLSLTQFMEYFSNNINKAQQVAPSKR